MKSACFSGYRSEKFPFKFDTVNDEYLDFQVKLLIAVQEAVNDGYERFYCGAAYGFDLLAAEQTFTAKWLSGKDIKLICVVPFKGQEEQWDADWQFRYKSVLEKADGVIPLADAYSKGIYYKNILTA